MNNRKEDNAMKLFEKKWDIEKDRLRIEFDIDSQTYVPYYGLTKIPYDHLTKKSKKSLEHKQNLLLTDPILLENEKNRIKIKQRYNKLKSLGYDCDCFEYLGPVHGTMSKEIESYLNDLVKEADVLLGIRRIGTNDSTDKIADILVNGLEITGHTGIVSGGGITPKELKNNVGYYPDNKTIIKELMYADCYKNSSGSILIRIPDEDLSNDIFITDKNGITRLEPKYIIGYIPIEPNHHIEKIIRANKIKDRDKKSPKFNFTTNTYDEYIHESIQENNNEHHSGRSI